MNSYNMTSGLFTVVRPMGTADISQFDFCLSLGGGTLRHRSCPLHVSMQKFYQGKKSMSCPACTSARKGHVLLSVYPDRSFIGEGRVCLAPQCTPGKVLPGKEGYVLHTHVPLLYWRRKGASCPHCMSHWRRVCLAPHVCAPVEDVSEKGGNILTCSAFLITDVCE